MKKLVFTLVAGFAMSSLFAANSIQWAVSDAAFKGEESGSLYFAYAMVAIGGGRATDAYLKTEDGKDDDAIYANATSVGTDAVYSIIPTDHGAGDTFFVQLYNADDELLGFSDGFTYEQLQALDAVYVPGIQGSGAGTWSVSAFNVPEPTSGLLMLLGFAGLALRRKRV